MNEVLMIILISILSSFSFFVLSYILIKKLKINHPKDRSKIYLVLMTSVLLLFIISINAISIPLQNHDLNNNSSEINCEDNYSMLVVMDETQIDNKNQELPNSANNDCDINPCCGDEYNSCCEDEYTYSSYQNILSIIIEKSEKINSTISKLILTKTNYSINSLNSETPKNENLLYSVLSDNQIYEKQNHENSPYLLIFLGFQFVLLLICLFYIVFTLIFSYKFILKNINAQKCKDPKIIQIVNKLCKEIKIKIPELYVFNGEPNAFIFGYPIALVISKKLIKYLSDEELEIAIRHELGHISNKDHLLKPLLQSIRIMFFYNPVVHILYSIIMKERELLADSKYINSKFDKIRFMEILLKINELSKKQNIFSNKLYSSSSLLLVSQKIRKLNITERYNQLFSARKKKSFFTILICVIIILSNISIISLASNNLLKNDEKINEDVKKNACGEFSENYFNNKNIKTIYILRFIKEKTHVLDIINVEDTFCE
jgi:beta-lactamase regulating signal transducer with metallopeptidase domain